MREEGRGKREEFVRVGGKRRAAGKLLPRTLPSSLFPVLFFSCSAITVRPSYGPFPRAAHDTLDAQPDAVITAAADSLRAIGFDLRVVTPAEGYLETRWFDPATRRSRGTNEDPSRLYRVRVWADLVTPRRSQIVVESVRRRSVDPSLPEREDEFIPAPGTPGDSLTQRLRRALKAQFTP